MNFSPVSAFIVDDSAFMRRVLTDLLEKDGQVRVVGYARNGEEALEKIPLLKPQVVTLDVEMPGKNGLEILEVLMRTHPLPVLMVSSLTTEGAEATIRALELGAIDFVAKPSRVTDLESMAVELLEKIKAIAQLPASRLRILSGRNHPAWPNQPLRKDAGGLVSAKTPARNRGGITAVGIGTSTGGPSALYRVVTVLPSNFWAPILIVQHMPPGFTRPLAERLNEHSHLTVREAEEGMVMQPGQALVAPAGFQTYLEARGGEVRVHLDTRVPFATPFKPSVDVALQSLAGIYRAGTLGVVLTGMGNDGVRGFKTIKEEGGRTLAEAESTCIVYGMPRAVAEAGLVDMVVPLEEMAAEIIQESG